jgi:hypothetical protein
MRRCNNCFHFSPGRPTFCAHCGRTFGARICARGHANRRDALYCEECGNAELSTPAPRETVLQWLANLLLSASLPLVSLVAILALIFAVLMSIDWDALSGPLVSLVLMLGLLYWLTTLVPGPVKRAGKAVGRRAMQAMTSKGKRH